jgi:hypothetical protein
MNASESLCRPHLSGIVPLQFGGANLQADESNVTLEPILLTESGS